MGDKLYIVVYPAYKRNDFIPQKLWISDCLTENWEMRIFF
jgi:hypothetical protein